MAVVLCAAVAPACGAGAGVVATDVPGALPVSVTRDTKPEADPSEAVAGMNAFGVALLQELRADGADNVIISPYSISTALGMVYAGARGRTATQMAEALGYPDPPERTHSALNALLLQIESRRRDGVELAIANQVWAAPGLDVKQSFISTIAGNYGAPMAEQDFARGDAAEKAINGWVADRTNKRIPELFPAGSFDGNTKLVLANALYLNADWQRPFDRAATAAGQFERPDGSMVGVTMMHNDRELPSATGKGWSAAELAYAGEQLSMVVIIPSDIESFERSLTGEKLDEIFAAMQDGGIHFAMPRVSFSFSVALPTALQRLGMRDAFGPADFSGMTLRGGLAVDQVEHEVFIAFDEEGTEAAAATGAEMVESHGPTVEANRPYLVVIRDRPTGAILFLGTVTDPSAEPEQ